MTLTLTRRLFSAATRFALGMAVSVTMAACAVASADPNLGLGFLALSLGAFGAGVFAGTVRLFEGETLTERM